MVLKIITHVLNVNQGIFIDEKGKFASNADELGEKIKSWEKKERQREGEVYKESGGGGGGGGGV